MTNEQLLRNSMEQLAAFVQSRLALHFSSKTALIDPVTITNITSQHPAFEGCSPAEQMTLLIALVPHLLPGFYETLIQQYLPQGGDFTEFGGAKGTNYRGMLPTGETVQFLLAGTDFQARIQVMELFGEGQTLSQRDLCWLDTPRDGEPRMSGRLVLSTEWLDKVLFGRETLPRFSAEFPARRMQSRMSWEDVVLHPITQIQINDISTWLEHHARFNKDENLGRKVKPGYRALFYGPPGTGKTLTATLLGQQFNREVYRIDLSQVISKYIGETEKNLEKIFSRAAHKDWILFFDEADALFGKRTNVQSSNDRFANQEVSYLLQRVEDFPGLMILASNFRNNLDEAFLRRFHSIIHFPMPNADERLQLWQKSLPVSIKPQENLDLRSLADRFELTGASILNVMHYATLQTFARNSGQLQLSDVLEGVRKELMKEEKTF